MRILFLTCVAVCGGAAAAAPAWAERTAPVTDGHALLQRGIALHREAAYAASVAALEQARATRTLAPAELVECAFYLGASYVALNSLPAARRELRAVIDTQPSYEVPQYTSPKVVALFRDVREEAERAPRLKALPPRRPSRNSLELEFDASRTGGTAFGVAYWRWRGEREFHEAPLTHRDDHLVAPLALGQNGTVEYYAESRAPSGYAQAGSRARPLELPIAGVDASLTAALLATPPRKSVLHSWWLWSAVGAVAVTGLGLGLYFGLRPVPRPTADAVLDFQVR